MGGYGSGIVVETIFKAAGGAITTGTPVSAIMSGPLVLVLTAIGFGFGIAWGWDEHEKAETAAKAA